ncbi:thermostable hemolysin [Pseudomonas zhanjiangensis]|uniref:Thermostable hemolysin n=1 Tax=Pseudomonas zhanjiangensis TaxID=3239015 RepID=A0ABV3YSG4_9PSED
MDLAWVHQHKPLAQIGRERPLSLFLAPPESPRRAVFETFIRERFAAQHGARVRHFMPCLLGLEDSDGQLLGAVGLRSGAIRPLFLERYLQQPVETVIAAQHGLTPPAREQLVEVGNLAAGNPGAARLLIVALTDLLVALGYRWVCFTGTLGLLNSFQRLGLQPLPLGAADPACMGEERVDWGHYYDNQPQVMAGDIYAGHQRLLQLGVYPRLGLQTFYATEGLPDVACR